MSSPDIIILDFGSTGDAYLLPLGDGNWFLLDTGKSGTVFEPSLKKAAKGKKIVGLVLSHQDADHVNGLRPLVNDQEKWDKYMKNLEWVLIAPLVEDELETSRQKESKSYMTLLKNMKKRLNHDQQNDWVKTEGWKDEEFPTVVHHIKKVTGKKIEVLNHAVMYTKEEPKKPTLLKSKGQIGMNPNSVTNTNRVTVLLAYVAPNGKRWFLTGDSGFHQYGKPARKYLKRNGFTTWDVVKVPHHGSINNVINEHQKEISEARKDLKAILKKELRGLFYIITGVGNSHHPHGLLVTELCKLSWKASDGKTDIHTYTYVYGRDNAFIGDMSCDQDEVERFSLSHPSKHDDNIVPLTIPWPKVAKPKKSAPIPDPPSDEKVVVVRKTLKRRRSVTTKPKTTKKRKISKTTKKEEVKKRKREEDRSETPPRKKRRKVVRSRLRNDVVGAGLGAGAELPSLASSLAPNEATETLAQAIQMTFSHSSKAAESMKTSVPSIFGRAVFPGAAASASDLKLWVASSVEFKASSFDESGFADVDEETPSDPSKPKPLPKLEESFFSATLKNPDKLQFSVGNNLKIDIEPATEFKLEIFDGEVSTPDAYTRVYLEFSATMKRLVPLTGSSKDTWQVDVTYQEIDGEISMSVWTSELQLDSGKTATFQSQASAILDLNHLSHPINDLPLASASSMTIESIGIRLTPSFNNVLSISSILGYLDQKSIPKTIAGLKIAPQELVVKYSITRAYEIDPAVPAVPSWNNSLAQASIQAGFIAIFESANATVFTSVERYGSDFEFDVSASFHRSGESLSLADSIGAIFEHAPSEFSTSSVGDFLPSVFQSILDDIVFVEGKFIVSTQSGVGIEMRNFGFGLFHPDSVTFGSLPISINNMWFDISVDLDPITVSHCQLAATVVFGRPETFELVLAAMVLVPTTESEGMIKLSFETDETRKLNLSNAFSMILGEGFADAVNTVAKVVPGLSLLVHTPLESISMTLDTDWKPLALKVVLHAGKTSDSKEPLVLFPGLEFEEVTISATIFIGNDLASSSFSIIFEGTSVGGWNVELGVSHGNNKTICSGGLIFPAESSFIDIAEKLLDSKVSVDTPPSGETNGGKVLELIHIRSASIAVDVQNGKLLNAQLEANLSKPILIGGMVRLDSMELSYSYDGSETPQRRHQPRFEAHISLGDNWALWFEIQKEDGRWTFNAHANSDQGGAEGQAGIPFSNLLNKVVSGPLDGSSPDLGLLSGPSTPDSTHGMVDLIPKQFDVWLGLSASADASDPHSVAKPFQFSAYGAIEFHGVPVSAEVVVMKATDGWWYGFGVRAGDEFPLHLLLDSSSSAATNQVEQLSKSGSGFEFGLVSSSKLAPGTPTFRYMQIGEIISQPSVAGKDSPILIAALSLNMANSDNIAIKHLGNVLHASALQIFGIFSKSDLYLQGEVKDIHVSDSVNISSAYMFVQFSWSAHLEFILGIGINALTFQLYGGKSIPSLSGRMFIELGTNTPKLALALSLKDWKQAFGLEWLTITDLTIGGSIGVDLLLHAIEIGAGVSLTRNGKIATNIKASFKAEASFDVDSAHFFLQIDMENCTFASLYEFIFDSRLPECFNNLDVGFRKLHLYLAEAAGPFQLLTGESVSPTFRCQGDFVFLMFELYWDITIPMQPGQAPAQIIAAAKPVHLLNGNIKFIAAPPTDEFQEIIKTIPLFASIPKEFEGGPFLIVSGDPLAIAFSAELDLFGLSAPIQGALSSTGVAFKFAPTFKSPALKAHLTLEANLGSKGFDASGDFGLSIELLLPELSLFGVVILKRPEKPETLDLTLQAHIWATKQSMGFTFSGSFNYHSSLLDLDLKILVPNLKVNIPFKNFEKEIGGAVGAVIGDNIGELLLTGFKNISNIGHFLEKLAENGASLVADTVANLAKAFGRGLEETAALLKARFGLDFEGVAKVLGVVFNVVAEVLGGILKAVGWIVGKIIGFLTDVVEAIGDFFAGLFGGYSSRQVLKKLSLVGNSLSSIEEKQKEVEAQLDALNEDLDDSLHQAQQISTEIAHTNGELWELSAGLDQINSSLEDINLGLQYMHDNHKTIQQAINSLAEEDISWRQWIVITSPYVLTIDAAYSRLVQLSPGEAMYARIQARDILKAGTGGILEAMLGIHNALIGHSVTSTDSADSLIQSWYKQATRHAKDRKELIGLVDLLITHMHNVQQHGLILLINAWKFIGAHETATAFSETVHARMMQQLKHRARALSLPGGYGDGEFFSHKPAASDQIVDYVLIDFRAHALKDEETRNLFGFHREKVKQYTDEDFNGDPRTAWPVGVAFDKDTTSLVSFNQKIFLKHGSSIRALTPSALKSFPGLSSSKPHELTERLFCENIEGSPIDTATKRSNTMGFAKHSMSADTGAMMWEKGETGPRIKAFDLVRLIGTDGSRDLYLSFDKVLRKLSPEMLERGEGKSNFFLPTDDVRSLPFDLAHIYFPLGPELDLSAKLYHVIIDEASQDAIYYLHLGGKVRPVDKNVVAQCRFDPSSSTQLTDPYKQLQDLGTMHTDIQVGATNAYLGKFAPLVPSSGLLGGPASEPHEMTPIDMVRPRHPEHAQRFSFGFD